MVWHCTGEDIALREFMEYHGGMQWRLSEMVWHYTGEDYEINFSNVILGPDIRTRYYEGINR